MSDGRIIFNLSRRTRQETAKAMFRRCCAALLTRSTRPLGEVDVQDITFSSEVTGGEDDLTMTIYYHRQPRRR